ncbi:hypothetical protein ACFL3A_15160, partial [Pseudomonadota bacterium]
MMATRVALHVAVTLLFMLMLSCSDQSGTPETDSPWDKLPQHPLHTDHSTFFQTPFADGPSVTRACLECHPDASTQIMQTAHWNWRGEEAMLPGHATAMRVGKRNL